MGIISKKEIAQCTVKIEATFNEWISEAHGVMAVYTRDHYISASYTYNGKTYNKVRTVAPVISTDTESFKIYRKEHNLKFNPGDPIQVYINPENPKKMFFRISDDMTDTLMTNQYADNFN